MSKITAQLRCDVLHWNRQAYEQSHKRQIMYTVYNTVNVEDEFHFV